MDNISNGILAAIAIIALISPIATTLINNSHESKMKQIEQKQQMYQLNTIHKRELCEEYLKLLADSARGVPNGSLKLMEKYYVLLPYIPQKFGKTFGDFTLKMANIHLDNKPLTTDDSIALTEIINIIREQIEPK